MKALALLTSRDVRPDDLLEWLQIVGALVACDVEVRVAETEAAAGTLAGDDLADEAERILEQLASLGVGPEVLGGPALQTALAEAATVLRLGAPTRTGAPEVLELAGSTADLHVLAQAGQVVTAFAAHP